MRWTPLVPAAVIVTILAARPTQATILVAPEAPEVQNSIGVLGIGGVETFSDQTIIGTGTIGFPSIVGSRVSGSQAGIALGQADQSGGVDGGGPYATIGGGAATGGRALGSLAVAGGQGVARFGPWVSGLDPAGRGDDHMVGRHAAIRGPVVSRVPEPATWATGLMGFGLLGSLLRRRDPAADALG